MAKVTEAKRTLIEGSDNLAKEATAIHKAAGGLADRIQTFLISASAHAHKHSDATALIEFIEKAPRGTRGNAMKEWATMYAPVGLNNSGKFIFMRAYEAKDDAARAKAIEASIASPNWDTLKPEPAFVPFDLDAALASLLKKAKAAADDVANKDKHKVDPAKLAKLTALAV